MIVPSLGTLKGKCTRDTENDVILHLTFRISTSVSTNATYNFLRVIN
jgi:hypothetical protein